MRYPINWVLGAVLFTAVCAICGAVLVFIAVARILRRRRWPNELLRRRSLPIAMAHVEQCQKITDEDVRLVLTVEDGDDRYREPRRVRLRAIVRLPAEAVAALEVDDKIPLRYSAESPATSTIDFASLIGGPAADAERDAYLLRGLGRWEIT